MQEETYFPRLRRLRFLLTEIGKPFLDRDPEMREIVTESTLFDMRVVTVGQRLPGGRLLVRQCDVVGLAALDPKFNEWGLRPSLIKFPPPAALDFGGVMLRRKSGNYVRVQYSGFDLPIFFGLHPLDWQTMTDGEWYRNKCGVSVSGITPTMVLERLDNAVRNRYGIALEDLCKEEHV